MDLSFNNWLLLSGNRYRARRFKPVGKLRSSGLAMMAQIGGSNHIRLLPIPAECGCPAIQIALLHGEIGIRWFNDDSTIFG